MGILGERVFISVQLFSTWRGKILIDSKIKCYIQPPRNERLNWEGIYYSDEITVRENFHTYIAGKKKQSRSLVAISTLAKEEEEGGVDEESDSSRGIVAQCTLGNRIRCASARTHVRTRVRARTPENGTRSRFQRGPLTMGSASISVFGSRTQCGALTCLYSCTRRATKRDGYSV